MTAYLILQWQVQPARSFDQWAQWDAEPQVSKKNLTCGILGFLTLPKIIFFLIFL